MPHLLTKESHAMTATTQAPWERVADVSELPPGGRKSIFVDDIPALLVRLNDEYCAIEDVCTHDGQPLTDGPIANGQITCPRHGARFDLRTGRPLCMPATQPVRTFAVRWDAEGVYVSTAPAGVSTSATPEAVSAAESSTANSSTVASTTDSAAAAANAESAAMEVDDQAIIEALRQVVDPELFINVIDLGLVYSITHAEGKVLVEMTLTSPACPAGPQIIHQAKTVLERLPGVREAQIKLVMSPPWTPDRMTDEARDQLGFF
jgi:metal-sulfur cluster biosynthetic enzyme/nitrite reductase/ring-hydroxylating ferredoxin subunit